MPPDRRIHYVPAGNEYMQLAKKFSKENSLDKTMPTTSVLVRDGKVIAMGANGSDYHRNNICERVKQKIPTGQGYELCEGCHPKNHSESKAIRDAIAKNEKVEGADHYLWGHWWCCQPCWDAMLSHNIANVYLMEGSEKFFDKNHPENIVGRQFED